jgi:hypothetical protein
MWRDAVGVEKPNVRKGPHFLLWKAIHLSALNRLRSLSFHGHFGISVIWAPRNLEP